MSHVTPTRRIVSHPPSDRVTFWIGTGIVHGAQQKTSISALIYGTPFVQIKGLHPASSNDVKPTSRSRRSRLRLRPSTWEVFSIRSTVLRFP